MGFVLVVLGAVLPFLMVMHIITSTLFLNFFSYTASVAGLLMGVVGSAYIVRYHRAKNKRMQSGEDTTPEDRQDW